ARQFAGRTQPARYALLHRFPDVQQPGADLRIGTPRAFVFEHYLRDGLVFARADFQQLLAGRERMRQRRGVGDDAVLRSLVLVHHETAPDRVVIAGGQHVALRVVGGETHAVCVVRQLLALVEDQIGLLVEGDLVSAMQADALLFADARQPLRDRVRIDTV